MSPRVDLEAAAQGDSLTELLRRELPGFETEHDGRTDLVRLRTAIKLGGAFALDPIVIRGGTEAMNAALVGKIATELRAKAIELTGAGPGIEREKRDHGERRYRAGEADGYRRGLAIGEAEGRRKLLAELAAAAGWEGQE